MTVNLWPDYGPRIDCDPGAGLDALVPIEVTDPLVLHRFTVKPGHLEAWLGLWPALVAARRRAGFTWHRAFVETDAEPKVTWLYSHPDPEVGERLVEQVAAAQPHVFRNTLVRRVRPEVVTHATASTIAGRIAIMRRYTIVGGWPEFLAIWRQIVPVRERYGFRCLFAVVDEPADLFTWAFDFAGEWADFPAAQRDYYRDPARVVLRGVFDHMADYSIHPATQLLLPEGGN